MTIMPPLLHKVTPPMGPRSCKVIREIYCFMQITKYITCVIKRAHEKRARQENSSTMNILLKNFRRPCKATMQWVVFVYVSIALSVYKYVHQYKNVLCFRNFPKP